MFNWSLIFGLTGLAVAGYVGYRIATIYRATSGTAWERLLATTKNSATLLVSTLTAAITALGQGILSMSDYLGMPEVRDFVQQYFTPEVSVGIIAGVTALTFMARLRTMNSTEAAAPPEQPYDGAG